MSQEATAAAKAPRPSDVVIVTLLALIAAAGDVIAGVAYLISGPEGGSKALAYVLVLVGLATAAVAALLFSGSRLARTLIAVFMIARIAIHIWEWISIGSDAAVASMIQILIAVTVLALLFTRESSAYLTGMKR